MVTDFARNIIYGHSILMDFCAYTCNLAHFPNSTQNSAFGHIVHSVGSH